MTDEPNYPDDEEPERAPWEHNFEARPKDFDGHWHLDGDWLSKTQAQREFNLSQKQFEALLEKAKRENLPLRTKTLQHERYGNSFVVYNAQDLKRLLGREVKK
jgi:hypothetical protein